MKKFERLSEPHVTRALSSEIVDAISRLESIKISEFTRLLGAAEWDSPEAIALIRRYLNSPSGGDGAQIGSKT